MHYFFRPHGLKIVICSISENGTGTVSTVFEPSKDAEQPAFDGLKPLGASFSQEFQSLTHSNTPNYVPEFGNPQYNATRLFATTSSDSTSATPGGFNTAMANLTIDAQLADGITECAES
ncbi:MAG: hypothetical protein U0T81_12270 [Saprospiraceae bacterium]